MNKKLVIISITALITLTSGYFWYNKKNNSDKGSISKRNIRDRNNKDHHKMNKKRDRHERMAIKKPKTQKNEWQEIGDYPHKEKIIKNFQRFRSKKKEANQTPPKVELKLGKLFEKKQRKKTFKIREILVSIDGEKGEKTFVAMVNEDTGKIIQKQGRRINEPLSKVGRRVNSKNIFD